MTDRLDTSMLDDAMQFASQDARHALADSLAAHLHNDGYSLEGITEANDVEWFARRIYEQRRGFFEHRAWDLATKDDREAFCNIARAVISELPAYQLRVAHRLITLSKVVRDIERAERKQRNVLRDQPRPTPGERRA